jgi:putative cell wall-binding protein
LAGRTGFVYMDSSRVELHGICNQKIVKAIILENQVIKLLYDATQEWEKSVDPESTTKYIEEAEADLHRQKNFIFEEILPRKHGLGKGSHRKNHKSLARKNIYHYTNIKQENPISLC